MFSVRREILRIFNAATNHSRTVSTNLKKMSKSKIIDLELEKIVFLCNAEEGNPGIYELTWELGYYEITIEEKYRISKQILTKILSEELVTLEKYSDLTHSNKIETIKSEQFESLLNNPFWWYPCNEILSIELTEKGEAYLDEKIKSVKDRLNERWSGKK